ncbi:MAG TPA: TetR/AcrR family transcriptional regulator [Gemmatimonadaceae bacterium]|jgi:AcrR family transcriptional regulator
MVTTTSTLPPRQRILAAADDLFRRQGIRGVGVDAIAEAAGTNKMTLYRHFTSKDELVAEWIRGIIAEKDGVWEEIVAEHPNNPVAQLIDWSRRTSEKFAEIEDRGSPLLNAIAELPETDHPGRKILDDHRVREHARILELCRQAEFENPDLTADHFFILLEGAKSCLQCIGMKRVGEHLVQMVDTMVANRKAKGRAKPATRR